MNVWKCVWRKSVAFRKKEYVLSNPDDGPGIRNAVQILFFIRAQVCKVDSVYDACR